MRAHEPTHARVKSEVGTCCWICLVMIWFTLLVYWRSSVASGAPNRCSCSSQRPNCGFCARASVHRQRLATVGGGASTAGNTHHLRHQLLPALTGSALLQLATLALLDAQVGFLAGIPVARRRRHNKPGTVNGPQSRSSSSSSSSSSVTNSLARCLSSAYL